MIGTTPREPGLVGRLRRRDLDSEGDNERSFFEGRRRPDSRPERKSVGEGANRNRGITSAFCASGAEAVRRASSRTNATAADAALLQLSSPLTLGDVVES